MQSVRRTRHRHLTPMYRIGFDVGGTFTDLTVLDEETGAVRHFKVPSSQDDPSEAIQTGIRHAIEALAIDPDDVGFLGHGTTIATNMVIERKGSPTAVLTTAGFRDVLEIGRQERPHVYDYTRGKSPPLVPREHRYEVRERIDAAGRVLVPLDEESLDTTLGPLERAGIKAVAICFLHSYLDADHEARTAAAVAGRLPDAFLSLSFEVLPEFREYERLSTTVANAYVGPRMSRYLETLVGRLRELGVSAAPHTIHSNGGVMSLDTARRFPVRTCLSGPAAGVIGAAEAARQAGYPHIVTFDVGGTSTDVSLVRDSTPRFSTRRHVAGFPIGVPMLDVNVIGAGGGSIAAVDDAGALKVGPSSAGAVPGPVAYGLGGTEPTLTDANLVLGRLGARGLAGGSLAIDRDAATRAIADRIARPLAIDTTAAAAGIIRIAVANMARAIRAISTERGHDVAEFALFAYGGAGPLHAAEVARECGLSRVVVPPEAGTACARGILMSDISLDFVRSEIRTLTEATWTSIRHRIAAMIEEADAWLETERVHPERRRFRVVIDARYRGQNHEVRVVLGDRTSCPIDTFRDGFARAHQSEYGYLVPDRDIEIVNCRVQAIGAVVKADIRPLVGDGSPQAVEERSVCFEEGWRVTPVYLREAIGADAIVEGPAVIEEMSSTAIVWPGQRGRTDEASNLIIESSE